MSNRRTFYVTTPIYYVNDLPHIGHSYTTIVADCLARYHRMIGEDVRFLTGTDEHGQKIERAAKARGVSPKELADEVVENYQKLWPALSISHDDFIRTTDMRHQRGVYSLLQRIQRVSPEAIYKGSYRGWYCTGCESFYAASQVEGRKCPDFGHPVEEVEESSWFFRLSAYADKLLALYNAHPEFVTPESRLNEVRSFVAGGLKDLSISRTAATVSWGIPFPGDPEHTIYVWFDALTNYISALGYGDSGRDALYGRYWRTMNGESVHLVGKDILRFHAVYWPAFLMAADEPLPTTVVGHGWWLRDATKMSKSLGNVVRLDTLLPDFGADAIRWFLLREIPLGQDGNYSDEGVLERTNADLANNIGNLFSRVTTLIEKGEGGTIPEAALLEDEPLTQAATAARATYDASFARHEPAGALRALTEWADALNKYLVRTEPWKRTGREGECTRALATVAQHLAQLTLRLAPAMPTAAAKMWSMLGLGEDPVAEIRAGANLFAQRAWPVAGRRVTSGMSLFPRLDKQQVLGSVAAPTAAPKPPKSVETAAAGTAKEAKVADGVIDIDTFFATKLRTAKVLECEKHPSADKLLRLVVDLGNEQRQIIAGIAKAYTPEQLLGRTIIVVANLKPALLRGLESQGMLLAATGPDGVPHLLMVDGEVPPGSKVG